MTINPVSTTQDSAAPVVYARLQSMKKDTRQPEPAVDVGSNRLVGSLVTMAERVIQAARQCGAEYIVNHEHIDDLALAVRAVISNVAGERRPPLTSSDLLEQMATAGMELAEYASYAEIVGGVSVNQAKIRKWCDELYMLHKQLNAVRSNK